MEKKELVCPGAIAPLRCEDKSKRQGARFDRLNAVEGRAHHPERFSDPVQASLEIMLACEQLL